VSVQHERVLNRKEAGMGAIVEDDILLPSEGNGGAMLRRLGASLTQ
jgi:hypothetical protein